MTRKLNLALLVLAFFVGLPFGWLMLDSSLGGATAKPISMAQLRRLATAVPGEPPIAVRYELLGRHTVIGDLLAAGSGLRPVRFGIRAYQVTYADGRTVTIDRGLGRTLAKQLDVAGFDAEAQTVVAQAVAKAQLNLTLANGPQHSGAMKVSPRFGSGTIGGYEVPNQAPYAVSTGIVVVPADDVADGMRMVYIRLMSGEELILAGDVAPVRSSWQELRPPARLRSDSFKSGDRDAVARWLLTLRKLKDAAPGLDIVAGHDSMVPRILIHGFTSDPRVGRFARDKRLALQAMMR